MPVARSSAPSPLKSPVASAVAERVVRLGDVEQQVLVLEVLRADGGEADPAKGLGEGRRVSDHRQGHQNDREREVPDEAQGGGRGLDSHAHYA